MSLVMLLKDRHLLRLVLRRDVEDEREDGVLRRGMRSAEATGVGGSQCRLEGHTEGH